MCGAGSCASAAAEWARERNMEGLEQELALEWARQQVRDLQDGPPNWNEGPFKAGWESALEEVLVRLEPPADGEPGE